MVVIHLLRLLVMFGLKDSTPNVKLIYNKLQLYYVYNNIHIQKYSTQLLRKHMQTLQKKKEKGEKKFNIVSIVQKTNSKATFFTENRNIPQTITLSCFTVNTMSHLKGSLSTQEFNNIFSSNFCFPSINRPTRVTNHSASNHKDV